MSESVLQVDEGYPLTCCSRGCSGPFVTCWDCGSQPCGGCYSCVGEPDGELDLFLGLGDVDADCCRW
jgi:hypothetical protein